MSYHKRPWKHTEYKTPKLPMSDRKGPQTSKDDKDRKTTKHIRKRTEEKEKRNSLGIQEQNQKGTTSNLMTGCY